MPFTTHLGHKIHYTTHGSGPLVVLQHGFLSNAASWLENGYVTPLAQHYQVVCIDSLAHGLSDKPADPQRYQQQHRAGDIVAVLDDIGAAQAHVLGYSMGGWMAAGVAQYYPQRLASLTIGGWDFIDGMRTAFAPLGITAIEFNNFMTMATSAAPELTRWVTDNVRSALGACFAQLANLHDNAQAVSRLPCPLLLWNGNQDPYHATMAKYAAEHDVEYFSTPGDHLSAMINSGAVVAECLHNFIQTNP